MSSLKIARALAELQQARPGIALQLLERQPSATLSPSWTGEYLASRALALAVASAAKAALDTADAADEATIAVEARGLSAFARAIAHCRTDSPHQESTVRQAFEQAAEARNVDGLVSAYRAYPPLLERIWQYCDKPEFLFEAVERAGDASLARSASLPVAAGKGGSGVLSAREKEILDLLRQGLTNAEIAQALFIGVSTVKVHVRHIFEKLGVRTRTEAALVEVDDQ